MDNYSELNNNLIDILQLKNNSNHLIKLKEEIQTLKKENIILKNKINANNNYTPIKSKFEQEKKERRLFSCFNRADDSELTMNFNKNK